LDQGTPELIRAMEDQTITISDAAALAGKPKKVQDHAVDQVREGKAKTLRAAIQADGAGDGTGAAPRGQGGGVSVPPQGSADQSEEEPGGRSPLPDEVVDRPGEEAGSLAGTAPSPRSTEPSQKVLDSGITVLIEGVRSGKASNRDAEFVVGLPDTQKGRVLNFFRTGKDKTLEDAIVKVLGGSVEQLLDEPRLHKEARKCLVKAINLYLAINRISPNSRAMAELDRLLSAAYDEAGGWQAGAEKDKTYLDWDRHKTAVDKALGGGQGEKWPPEAEPEMPWGQDDDQEQAG
jgi:hypothetical protein